MVRKLAVGILSVLLMASAASAAVIDVGDHELLPNTPGQQIHIYVSGGDPVAGIDFFAMIADGGPELEYPPLDYQGEIIAPAITAIDLEAGFFSEQSGGQGDYDDLDGIPQLAGATMEVAGADNTLAAEGLLAILTIDTTAREGVTFEPGDTWALQLYGLDGAFETQFTPTSEVTTQVNNGWISIVPEPASGALLGMAGLMLLRRRRALAPRNA